MTTGEKIVLGLGLVAGVLVVDRYVHPLGLGTMNPLPPKKDGGAPGAAPSAAPTSAPTTVLSSQPAAPALTTGGAPIGLNADPAQLLPADDVAPGEG